MLKVNIIRKPTPPAPSTMAAVSPVKPARVPLTRLKVAMKP